MAHRRSEIGKIKQSVRRYVFDTSYIDYDLAETVCRVDRVDCLAFACTRYPVITVGLMPKVEKGLVLLDSRGEGAFQK